MFSKHPSPGGTFCNKDHAAEASVPFADLLGRDIFLAGGRLWSLQRKLASYSFSSRSLHRFSGRELREHLHRRLLPLLDAVAGSGVALDLCNSEASGIGILLAVQPMPWLGA
ncbi:cytochrome P450 94A1-like [Hordeum vulgare]|nr:cytochrome P450 94A1-like [Hordeum vulgare]